MTTEERAQLAKIHPELADVVMLSQEHLRCRAVLVYETERHTERGGATEDRDCGKRDYEAAKANEAKAARALNRALKKIWGCKRSIPRTD